MQIPDWQEEVGPGWALILTKLHEDLIKLDPEYRVAQVKEKFGSLRVYVDTYSREVEDRIDKAEAQSCHVCEFCGAKGELRNDRSWLKTLCDVCNGGAFRRPIQETGAL